MKLDHVLTNKTPKGKSKGSLTSSPQKGKKTEDELEKLSKAYREVSGQLAVLNKQRAEIAASILALTDAVGEENLNVCGKQQFKLFDGYKVGRTKKDAAPEIDHDKLRKKLSLVARGKVYPKLETFDPHGLQECIALKLVSRKTLDECTTYPAPSYSVLVRSAKDNEDTSSE